ncbi:MAG: hypothetical protein HY805_01190 [Nitrospirae bacterium]|nr:hypothetical protein [Nitrospirota bacterium]
MAYGKLISFRYMIKNTFIIIGLYLLFSTTAFGATYSGRVIDADTKKPIEGAVVVAVWLEERATIAGPSSRLKDVKETLTGKDGAWVIKGPKGRRMGNIKAIVSFLTGTHFTKPPEFIIFKPGYCSWPAAFGIDACKEKMKYSDIGEGGVVELPRLTEREDRLKAYRVGPVSGVGAYKKQKEFIRLLNEESKTLGLPGIYEIPMEKEK